MAIPKLCRLPRHLYREELVRRAPLRPVRDFTGTVVNGCEIVGLAGFIHDNQTAWLYRCRCGKLGLVTTANANSGMVGCGCKRIQHGQSRSPLYCMWRRIRGACYDHDDPCYHLYGARGVTVCRRWRDSASDFMQDVGQRPSPKHVLGLINPKSGFRPGNVEWITRAEASRRHGKQTMIEYRGQRLTISQWSRRLGISYSTIYRRISTCEALGADLSEALATPVGQQMPCVWGQVKIGRPRRLEWA